MVKKALFCLVFSCILFPPKPLFSHPHVFVDSSVTAVFDDEGLAGIRQVWIFDEMFSAIIIKNCDRNLDGKFSKKEKTKVIRENFSRLGSYNYFNQIEIDGKEVIIKSVKNADTTITDNNVLFSFFIPLNAKAGDKFKNVTISINDIEYYCDYTPVTEDEFSMKNAEPFHVTVEFVQNMQKSYYFGLVNPYEMRIRFKKK